MFSQKLAKSREFRRFSDHSQRKLQIQGTFELHHERDRFERISPSFKEVFVRAANRRLQHLLPDLRDDPADAIARCRTSFGSRGDMRSFVLDGDLVEGRERAYV